MLRQAGRDQGTRDGGNRTAEGRCRFLGKWHVLMFRTPRDTLPVALRYNTVPDSPAGGDISDEVGGGGCEAGVSGLSLTTGW